MILDRLSLNILGVIASTPHLAMKLPILAMKVGVEYANQKEARGYYNECLKPKVPKKKEKEVHCIHFLELGE